MFYLRDYYINNQVNDMTIQETIYYILTEYPDAKDDSRDFYRLMQQHWNDWDYKEREITKLLVKKYFRKLWTILEEDDYDGRRDFVERFSEMNSFNSQVVYRVVNNFKVAYTNYQNDDDYDTDDDDDVVEDGYSVTATADSLFDYDCFPKKTPLQIATMMCIIDTLNDLLSCGILYDAVKDINNEFALRGYQRNGKMSYVGVKAISDGIIAVAKWDMNSGGLDLSTIRNCTIGAGILRDAIIDIMAGR